jgi:hypothetical protein
LAYVGKDFIGLSNKNFHGQCWLYMDLLNLSMSQGLASLQLLTNHQFFLLPSFLLCDYKVSKFDKNYKPLGKKTTIQSKKASKHITHIYTHST